MRVNYNGSEARYTSRYTRRKEDWNSSTVYKERVNSYSSPLEAWNGRKVIRENLRKFIDIGFTAHHDVVEYWDGGPIKVFRGVVT
jgi:hypothetical protein